METDWILRKLPYDEPFLFVGKLIRVDENGAEGSFRFRENLPFYAGHFRGNPVTPGVILTETMAQIGLVCLGIFLMGEKTSGSVALTSTNIEFLKPVYPGEDVRVVSKKVYFRFNKLKCRVTMFNQSGDEVCSGEIAGMIL